MASRSIPLVVDSEEETMTVVAESRAVSVSVCAGFSLSVVAETPVVTVAAWA